MSDKLYQTDVFAWSAEQAALLRRVARGERVNGLDWENVIEEIEDVGRSERNAVESLLRQSLVHLLKICGWPGSDAVEHWRDEVLSFLADATARYTPAMRQSIDLDTLYRRALKQTQRVRVGGAAPAGLPPQSPFTLDDLLADDPDPDALVEKLLAAAPH